MGIIKRFLLGRAMRKATEQGIALQNKKNSLLSDLNEELKQTSQEYKSALKEAEQMAKIMETQRRIRTLREKTARIANSLDPDEEEEDDEEDDEEESGDLIERLGNQVIGNIARGFMQGQPQANSNDQTLGLGSDPQSPPENNDQYMSKADYIRNKAGDLLKGLSDEKVMELQDKYGGFF